MALENWMPELASKLGEIQDVQKVHTFADLPDEILLNRTFIVLPLEGDATYGTGSPALNVHYLRATLYTNAALLAAYKELVPFIDRVRRKLAGNIMLGGYTWNNGAGKVEHVLAFGRDGRFYDGPGGVEYNGKPHFGIHFYLEVKELDPLTVAA